MSREGNEAVRGLEHSAAGDPGNGTGREEELMVGGHGGVGWQMDSMTSEVFSNPNDCMIASLQRSRKCITVELAAPAHCSALV